jgi:enoyl-CoA hydratase/carnithine racemase
MGKYETIIMEKEGGIATIILNRPEASNALTPKMFQELCDAFENTRLEQETKVVLLTGAGKSFCAGGDIKELVPVLRENPSQCRSFFRELMHRAYLAIWNLEKPVIAAVNGVAAGGGCDLALMCDIRVASQHARFSEIYVNIGAMPDSGGTWLLPRLTGLSKACELIFSGDIIDANEAERIGLVNKVVPAGDLDREAREMAMKLAKGPAIAIGLAKSAIHEGLAMDFAQALESVAARMSICLQTEDVTEGLNAFLEKRKPQFKG